MKITGTTASTTTPRSDWNQTDPRKADYIKNKPDVCLKNPVYTATPDTLADVIKAAEAGAIINLTAGNYGLLNLHGKDSYTAENLTIIGGDNVNIEGVSIASGVKSDTLATNSDVSNATLPKGLTFKKLNFKKEFSLINASVDDLTFDECHFEVGACVSITPNYFEDNYTKDHTGFAVMRPDYLQLYPENLVIKKCTIENANGKEYDGGPTSAFYIIGYGSITLSDNTINNAAYDGIQIGGYSASPYCLDVKGKITITNNTIRNAKVRGINLFDINDSEVSVFGNKMYSCGYSGSVIRVKDCANSEFDFGGSDALHPKNTYNDVEISVGDKILVESTVIPVSKAAQKELAKKMNAVTTDMQYYGENDTTEDAFNEWLDNTVLPSMPPNSFKNIWVKCGAIHKYLMMGTVHKNRDGWATIDLTEQATGLHYTKVKDRTWHITEPTDLIYASGDLNVTSFTTKANDASRFYVVEVLDYFTGTKDTFVVNIYAKDAGTLCYTRPFIFAPDGFDTHAIFLTSLKVTKLDSGAVNFKVSSGGDAYIFRVTGYAYGGTRNETFA